MQLQKVLSVKAGFLMLLMLFAVKTDGVNGQVPVTAIADVLNPSPGDIVNISLAAGSESDLFYAETVVSCDPAIMEFLSVATGPLTDGGIYVSGDLGNGRTGVSVSMTSPSEYGEAGVFMVLSFIVNGNAPGGSTGVHFSDFLIADSSGEALDADNPAPVILDVEFTISAITLLTPGTATVEQGQSFIADAALVARGIDDQQRVACDIGVISCDVAVDWHGFDWSTMDFEEEGDGDSLFYSAEFAQAMPAGEWCIAVRASLDGGDFVYGGPDGTVSSPGDHLTRLSITPRPPFRYSLAEWNFDGESLLPSLSTAANRESALQIAGAGITGFLTGYKGMAVNSNNWSNTDGGLCYWWVEISTSGFTSVEVSSRQYGSGTGPRDFQLEYSFDGFQWYAMAGGEILVDNNWSSGVVERLPLPEEVGDRDRVLLRWIITSEVSVNGAVTGPTGTNRIDDILISGVNPHPQIVTVFPGDANNDGLVNADDVLPLGVYWLSGGPPAGSGDAGFDSRDTEQWIPAGATYADTNGDGIVDHRDLLAVGMNFGESPGSVNKDSAVPLASLVVDPLEGGRLRRIVIERETAVSLRGVAFSIEFQGIPSDMWKTGIIVPAFAGDHDEEELISFSMTDNDVFEAAFAFKGPGEDLSAGTLAGFELVIDEQWDEVFTVNLNRLSVSDSGAANVRMGEGVLAFSGGLSSVGGPLERIEDFLLKVSPNPLASVSLITFQLERHSMVRLDIIGMQGKLAATPFDGFLQEGRHRIEFDGSFLSPGVYLCRLTNGNGGSQVTRMVVLP